MSLLLVLDAVLDNVQHQAPIHLPLGKTLPVNASKKWNLVPVDYEVGVQLITGGLSYFEVGKCDITFCLYTQQHFTVGLNECTILVKTECCLATMRTISEKTVL